MILYIDRSLFATGEKRKILLNIVTEETMVKPQ